ncbi:MAG: serine/threonine protein kinase [Polyangiaceae bacterium]|jgi:serine/threonine protein kinase|nr:serine/threonine protein kinase [Polyangiaceae bacterium]MBK8942843.1 serine/threonine protein kinase [Polyangiaceae bacterium]
MIVIGRDDENLQGLLGRDIPSDLSPQVHYRPEQTLGKGGGSIAFLAQRVSPQGKAPVVVKVLRPAFVRKLGETANLLIRKEAVALGRLNERVPPTPFVVRLIDTGSLKIERANVPMELPWVAIEYVHGGALGTTLAQRVRRSLRDSGYAYDPARAALAIDCIGQGLAAVHDVGVIHRDLTPNNVLCSGRGADEISKIADFGVARPTGVQGTLSGALVGTPGFAAPELSTGDPVSTATDVFSLGSVIFFILTGEPLFNSMAEVMRSAETGRRRSLLEMPGLHPELRKNEKACRSIDLVLGWGCAIRPDARLSEALAMTSMVLPHLAAPKRLERSFISSFPRPIEPAVTEPREWRWTILHQPGSSLVIRNVAWDGHGRAIAATSDGISFWSGTTWKVASTEGLRLAGGVRFVQRVGAGRWILGGDDAQIAIYTTGGAVELVDGPKGAKKVEAFDGDLEDISVLVTIDDNDVVCLNTYATKRWLRPLKLDGVASISTVTRFDDGRWLVGGRKKVGGAYAALYSALDWELEAVALSADVRAFLASASRPRKAIGWLVGTQGAVLTKDADTSAFERVPGEPLLSAVALDPFARPWAASAGQIFVRDDVKGWTSAWKDEDVGVPIVSLFLDAGLCIAMTADGGIVEGRLIGRAAAELTSPSQSPPV